MPVGRWNWTGEVGIIAFDRDLVRVDAPTATYPALDNGYTNPVFESTVIATGEFVEEVTWIAFASKMFTARFCASVWLV
jgi:hypothetical protein